MRLLVARAEVDGCRRDVRIDGGVVTEVAPTLRPRPDEELLDARGGALLPGLHDHHLHLLALAAAAGSVDCGPPRVTSAEQLRQCLIEAAATLPGGAWLRGVGYHESVAGPLDRHVLDRLVADRPLRIQHRSGALWMLNSAALGAVAPGLDDSEDVERGRDGIPTGRLWRYDRRLRTVLGDEAPDLHPVGRRLSALGITGVTDATPDLNATGQALIADAVCDGDLPVQVQLLGADWTAPLPRGLSAGPRKLLLRDHDLPPLDELAANVALAHGSGRPVAVHCVTREALLLTLAAIEQVGAVPGDRVEHAAVVPPDVHAWMSHLGLRVVTQPCFIAARGDSYLDEVEPGDRDCLYPYAGLLDHGIPVAPSSDAPYGDLDPWRNMAAAAARTTPSGRVLGPNERVHVRTVLEGYLSPLDDPGGAARRITDGSPADLCLLAEPLDAVLAAPSAEQVRAVVTSSGRVMVR